VRIGSATDSRIALLRASLSRTDARSTRRFSAERARAESRSKSSRRARSALAAPAIEMSAAMKGEITW
jgi:hypothetical protein